jgi:hypothetical protein
VDKWQRTVDNPVRVAWARRYLRWLGEDRLQAMGYSLDSLLDQLRDTPHTSAEGVRAGGADLLELADSAAREVVKTRASSAHSSTWRRLLSA